MNTMITSIGSKKLLGLSFRPIDNDEKIEVVPPLLRQQVKSIVPKAGERWLAYLTHFRLSEDIMNVVECESRGEVGLFLG